jgi:hypothetical protein
MPTGNDATSSIPMLPSFRVSTWDSPDAPGPVLTLLGALTGWDSFLRIRDVVNNAFSDLPESRAVAFNLCELEIADPLCLSGLADALARVQTGGRRFRLLTPVGAWAEHLLPRLLRRHARHRVHRVREFAAVAVDTVR